MGDLIYKIAVWAPPVLLAITLHEAAHGYVADRLGDPTARLRGRLSLNPLRHVDPVGTVVLPAVLLALGGWIFGWAKPVPVAVSNLGNPRRDMALVALAGPAANLAMGLGWALVVRVGVVYHVAPDALVQPLWHMGQAGIAINTVPLVLNLLPLPPLDGGRVLVSALPAGPARALARVERFGIVVLLVLLVSGLLGKLLGPPVRLVIDALLGVSGVSS